MTAAFALAALVCFALGWRTSGLHRALRVALMAVSGVFATLVIWRLTLAGITETELRRAKAGIALLALWLVAMERRREAAGTPVPRVRVDGVALALAMVALGAWAQFGQASHLQLVHRRDVFHYYLGARYHAELGYPWLYECTAVAEAELRGPAVLRTRIYRELRTGIERPAVTALQYTDLCHQRFSAARWQNFRDDVKWFRDASEDEYWVGIQTDHGYNPTPVWTLLEGTLARLPARATTTSLRVLAAVDPLLLAAAFAALGWAFRTRTAALAMIFWGTQEPASAAWMAGTFLREDWFVLVLFSLCLQRRNRHALAGAALGWAAATRGFPAALLLGGGVTQLWSLARHRKLDPRWVRFALGFAASVVILVALSALYSGVGDWPAWLQHIRHHDSEMSSNRIGLRNAFEFTFDGRLEAVQRRFGQQQITDRWAAMRTAHWESWRRVYRVLSLALVAAMAWRLRRVKTPWMVTAASVGAVWCLAYLSSYYWAIAMVLVVLAAALPRWERFTLAMLAVMQVATVMPALSFFYDDRYAVLSALIGVYVLAAPAALGRWRGAR